MDHVASALKVDPLDFRMNNLIKKGDPCLSDVPQQFENQLPELVGILKDKCDYEQRKSDVAAFNSVVFV